ncbi:putative integral membrane protein (TIGR00698 family) [Plasticicumulans lactativorans]|uniref:Putative integral membrane protein (TIGR00698 family) n=1 Tax=Plasticicumulans lactativorans TaxID=1133106 RepID=A0A4R2L5S9_9GAMM|nr:putative sulfate exporter family transporter [Plasticicumulans lactativorans]TCO81195.1 putative integral membrane protein (TIGR00698 family) [Plasticicumulans lactativorans]
MTQPTQTPATPAPSPLAPLLGRPAALVPGLLASGTIGMAAAFIADHYGGPTLLYALLLGMAFHFLSEEGRCVAGVEFASRSVLRFGVALLGARITLGQIGSLGAGTLLMTVASVLATLAVGWLVARLLGLRRELGLLTGGAVAICGASAALAIAAVLPRHADSERDTLLTVVGVTTLSTLAMIIYPMVTRAFDLGHVEAGIFLGGTIHDVAQVVGAGYLLAPETGDIATVVKLLRVSLLVPVVVGVSWLFRQRHAGGGHRAPLLPGFLLAFVALVVVNSLGLIPARIAGGLGELSRACLVAAIAALGIRTSLKRLALVGWRPIAALVAETVFLAALVLAGLHWGI